MFEIDTSVIFLLFVVAPMMALVCFLSFTCEHYDTLPHRRWLMSLPGYAFLYRKCEGDTDLPDRSISKTLVWLAGLYLSVIAFLAPFANKLLGMIAWVLTAPVQQIGLLLSFVLCLVVICYFLYTVVTGLRAASATKYRFLPFVGLGVLLGATALCAMSGDVRLVVLFACKTTVLGFFGFLFFGAMLFALNESESQTGAVEVGTRFVNIILILLSVGSLASVVA